MLSTSRNTCDFEMNIPNYLFEKGGSYDFILSNSDIPYIASKLAFNPKFKQNTSSAGVIKVFKIPDNSISPQCLSINPEIRILFSPKDTSSIESNLDKPKQTSDNKTKVQHSNRQSYSNDIRALPHEPTEVDESDKVETAILDVRHQGRNESEEVERVASVVADDKEDKSVFYEKISVNANFLELFVDIETDEVVYMAENFVGLRNLQSGNLSFFIFDDMENIINSPDIVVFDIKNKGSVEFDPTLIDSSELQYQLEDGEGFLDNQFDSTFLSGSVSFQVILPISAYEDEYCSGE